jgi:hypothetical protein
MTTRCQRSWEVEAARDGRLTGTALESFEAHMRACVSCTNEAGTFEGLAKGLRALGTKEVDDVALRRLRNDILEAVDAEQTGRGRVGSRRGHSVSRLVAFAVAAVVLGLVAFASWRGLAGGRGERRERETKEAREAKDASEAPHVAEAVALQTTVDVTAGEGARYTRAIVGDAEIVELADGTLRLHVQRPAGGRRVVVKVPDGEIEDLGTVFEVVVNDGHAQRIGVHEGRVVVRLSDASPVTIEAGKAWKREGATASANANASTGAKAHANAGAKANANANAGAKAGAGAKADADASAEDAAYLDVIRLLRQGRETEARVAADSYLRQFPTGFRRTEMERVARVK